MRVLVVYRRAHFKRRSFESIFSAVYGEFQNAEYYTFENLKCLFTLIRLGASYDVIHITGGIYWLSLFFPRRKVLLTFHDFGSYINTRGWKRWVYWILWFQLPIFWSKYFTFVSHETKCDFEKYFFLTSNKNKVIIHNPIRPSFTVWDGMENLRSIDVLQIGGAPHKNRRLLIDIGVKLGLNVVVVGGDEVNIEGVGFYKDLTDTELAQLYLRSKYLWMVSDSEGFGVPVIEGLSMGCIPIISDLKVLKEVCDYNAIIVNKSNVESILKDMLFSKWNVEVDRDFLKRYKLTTIRDKYLKQNVEIYKSN